MFPRGVSTGLYHRSISAKGLAAILLVSTPEFLDLALNHYKFVLAKVNQVSEQRTARALPDMCYIAE